ncbi:hypothetical protein GCM10023187_04130 [Nibrella viscosa]|uniref:DUF6036 domain-containing protein n=1 Tax=Nibrella viscosa TaxID=1084524 RepID=A0ABP8JUA2_9BACT
MEIEYLNFVRLLNEEGVRYVVLGGHAVIAHGYLRTTGDVDIFIAADQENARRLLRVMERYGYTNGEFEESDFTRIPSYLSFSRYDGYIDLMNFTPGITFDDCFRNHLELTLQGVAVKFISLPDLIRNKKAVGRPQDLRDIENLPEVD